MNRTYSVRSNRNSRSGASSANKRSGFSLNSLRHAAQPELSRRLYKLIKSDNNVISAYETAGHERVSVATQLSEWGEQTNDDAISDISDKLGVVLSELGEQEGSYAHSLDNARGVLKQIRDTERSVQPSRAHRAHLADQISKLRLKEPESPKLAVIEQELVRAEAENLVAEAQLTNITRQKLKEAYVAEFVATIERAEKQIILAKHGCRLLSLLDDSPVIPGDGHPAYSQSAQARQILDDAENDLREWQPELMPTVTDSDACFAGANGTGTLSRQSLGNGDETQRRIASVTDSSKYASPDNTPAVNNETTIDANGGRKDVGPVEE